MDTSDHLAKWAAKLVNNHARFESFAWHEAPVDRAAWGIYYTHNRDSGLLDQSNAAVIAVALKAFDESTVRGAGASHWACGWVDGVAVRVYAADGSLTDAARVLGELVLRMEDYPVLDDDDYSRRETEATYEGIRQAGYGYVSDHAPKSWVGRVLQWFDAHDPSALESDGQDQGGYPDKEQILTALAALGYLSRDGREAFREAGL